jgi:HK97 family phage prohead protease
MNDIERRIQSAGRVELRKAEGEAKAVTLRGYAAKFNTLSEPMYGFREQIAPGAFADCLEDDVRALFNHDANHVLGRTTSGTLRVSQDDTGLYYEVDLPDTQAARDLVVSVERGDVTQSSFAFRVAPNGDTWDENEDGIVIRTITKMCRLYDVSPVTYPAYPDATVGMRGLEAYKAGRADEARGAMSRACRAEARSRRLRHIG